MATQQSAAKPTLEELTIVDTDSHLGAGAETLIPYIDERNGARRMIEKADHVPSDIFTNTRASPSFPNAKGGYRAGDSVARSGHGSPEGKRAYMDEFGIDRSLLSPDIMLGTINHDQTAVALASAYNDHLVDVWLDVDEGLYATLVVAHQVPDRAAEEIDRMAGEKDIVGVQLPGAGMIPPAGHWSYDPVYQAAQDNDLPIVMHSHDVQGAVTFPVQRQWAETFTESHAFTFPVEFMWHLISMICNGVPERFPDLQFVLQEPGWEWVPWMMWRLDDHYLENSEDLPALTKLPSEYISEQFFFTTQPLGHTNNGKHLAWMMEMAGGADTLLFSTDHPHPDFDTPEEVYQPVKARLEEDELRGIMGETAIELFGMK